jgi:DNA-directed RNA polymerase specialized sigma24 family protein
LQPDRPLAPWLFTIARRAAIDLYRRRAHGPEPVEPKDGAAIALPPSMEGIWEAWQIRIALDMLPADERDVVRAQHFAGDSLHDGGNRSALRLERGDQSAGSSQPLRRR